MIKFILIGIVVFWLLSKIFKYVFRFALIFAGKKVQKEMQKQAQQAASGHSAQHTTQKKTFGNVDVYTSDDNKHKQKKNFEGGEYVDFEEIKD